MHTSLWSRLSMFACGAGLLALLSGCVSTTVVDDPLTLPATSELSAVVISTTTNTGEIRGFDKAIARRLPPPGKAGEPRPDEHFVLKQIATGMSRDTSLFVGSLPPGEYEFLMFSDSKSRKSLHLKGTYPWLGTFIVKARQKIDLGRLILTPLNSGVLVGRSALVRSNLALIASYSPDHKRLFAGDVEAGWKQERAAADKVEEYALNRPVGAECATERNDGTVIAASRLGTVLLRSQEGRWRALRSGGLESLLCVAPADLPDAELVAVGEFGTLLRKPRGKDELVRIDTGDLPAGSLFGISGNQASGWYVAHQRGTDVTIFKTAAIDSGKWTAVEKASVAFDFWTGVKAFWTWNTPGGFGYATTSGKIRLLDFATGQWSERKSPKGERLIGFQASPTGLLGALTSKGGLAGAFAGVYFSKDEGQNWIDVQAPFTIKIAPVVQAMDGSMYMQGGLMSTPELKMSKDEGKTWTLQGPYVLWRHLLPLKNGTLIDLDLGQFGIFDIRSSRDGGKNWDYEYSNFDREAYQAQKK